jgi:hypothetical protein
VEALGFETILDIYSPRIGPNLKSVRLSMFKFVDSNSTSIPDHPSSESSKLALSEYYALPRDNLVDDDDVEEASENGEEIDVDDDDVSEEAFYEDNDTFMETDNAIVPDQNLDTIFFKASAKIQLDIVKKYIKNNAKVKTVKKFDVVVPSPSRIF